MKMKKGEDVSLLKRGIDISYHQGNIDFEKVRNGGIEFVILRSSYRNTVDKKFFEYVEKARLAGIQILGVYHFSYALTEAEAVKEADYMVKQVEKAGLGKEILCFFDFEYDTVKKAEAKGVTLGKKECNANTLAFCNRVEELGYKAGIYLNKDFYQNWYEPSVLSSFRVWLADYTGEADFPCLLQQYTSEGTVPGINTDVDMDYLFEEESDKKEDFKINGIPKKTRRAVVQLAQSWIGKNEADGSHREIIDIYNSYKGKKPRGLKMKYDWSWCAATWSALAIALDYTDIMPIEISCGELIKRAQDMDIWVEDDSYIPKPGDAILYDWQDSGVGDNTGWPDHVGTVSHISEDKKTFEVVEGNYNDKVAVRYVSANGKNIRGFITPKYDEEPDSIKDVPKFTVTAIAEQVLDGKWGNGSERKELLEKSGYNYSEVQAEVNRIYKERNQKRTVYEITAYSLKCREYASLDSKVVGYVSKGCRYEGTGNKVKSGGIEWIELLFTVIGKDPVRIWCSGNYLKEV